MVIKKIRLFAIVIASACLLAACSSSGSGNPTYKEFNAIKDATSINGASVVEIKDAMTKFIQILYNPKSQADLDASYDLISKYTSDGFIADLKRNVNTYKEGEKQTVTINSLDYGSGENQFDNMAKLLADISISSEKYEPTRVLIEFSFNTNGDIFKYDIWQYINKEG